MKSLEQLISLKDAAWPILQNWIETATNHVEVLEKSDKADECLLESQVSTHSFMGSIIHNTGGIVIDHGWLRILGCGSERMQRSIISWNKGRTYIDSITEAPYLFIADDALGGLFAVNGGYLGKDLGKVYYFAVDMLDWYQMDLSYTDFLLFALNGELDEFYEGFRWNGWEADVRKLSYDNAYSFVPFLWTLEGKDIDATSKKEVSIAELFEINLTTKESLDKK